MTDSARRLLPLSILVVVALLAVADGVYLTLVHIDYLTGRPGLASVCHAISEAGCTVTAGRFGHIAGIPIATIGFAGALTTFVMGLLALKRHRRDDDPARSVLLVLAAFSVLASIIMGALSSIEGSFCPFCVIWYGLNAVLLVCAWIARNAHHGLGDILDDALGSTGFAAMLVFSVALLGGVFGYNLRKEQAREELEQQLAKDADQIAQKLVEEVAAEGRFDLRLEGLPSKGPDDADVTLVEFGDFQCPHCRKLWESVEEYAEGTERPVRVVFANFPLDESCNPNANTLHPDACSAAKAAVCAHDQDAFWTYASTMFAHQDELGSEELVDYAKDLGLDTGAFERCMASAEATRRVEADIAQGILVDIQATPTFFINGYKFTGSLPPPLLAAVIENIRGRTAGPTRDAPEAETPNEPAHSQ